MDVALGDDGLQFLAAFKLERTRCYVLCAHILRVGVCIYVGAE